MNFYIFGGFEKNKYFLGYEEFVDIFFFWGGEGASQNWTMLRGNLYAFMAFLMSRYRMGVFLGVAKNFKYFFLGALIS